MTNEEKTNTKIYAAFIKAQKAFAPAIKTETNSHLKTKYADLNSCVKAVIDGLNNNNILLTQKHHNEATTIGIETILIHESGETLSSGILYVPTDKQTPQGYGAAITYARRYSLMTLCGISPEDDDGEAAEKDAIEKNKIKNNETNLKENKEVKAIPVQINLEKELNKKIDDRILSKNPNFKGLTFKEAAHKDPDQFGIFINDILTKEKNKTDYEWKERNIKKAKAFLDYVVTISPKDEIPF